MSKSRTLVLRDGPRDITAQGYHHYRVREAVGSRLLLEMIGTGLSGWVNANQVIPADQVLDYFTQRIRSDPAMPSRTS